MSLSSLKRQEPQPRREQVTVEQFIEEAQLYAAGQVIPFANVKNESDQEIQQRPFKRATFTLSDMAIEKLTDLSTVSGKAKSRILRELIADA